MHTPTPYRLGNSKPHASMATVVSDSAEGLEKIGGAGGPDAVEYYGGNMIAESVAPENAAFIVKACNSHERLIAFLREMEEMQDLEGGHLGTDAYFLRTQLEREGNL